MITETREGSIVKRTSKKCGTSTLMAFADAVGLLASCKSCTEYPSRLHIAAAIASGETIETAGYTYRIVRP